MKLQMLSLWILAALFVGAGLMHLLRPQPFIQIVPPWVPIRAPTTVLFSGIAEIAGGLGILVPFSRTLAGWGLIALLIAVFPANVYMALRHIHPLGTAIPAGLLWARLPFQPLLIWWVWAATKNK